MIERKQSAKQNADASRHYAIFCDESGVDGSFVVGFGSLWMPWERRGDFAAKWDELKYAHYRDAGEIKWKKVSKATLPLYLAIVDWFFATKWLMFHCLVVGWSEVDLALHDGDRDLARRKHFTMLLANKLKRFARPGKRYRIRVDPIHSRYAKADEAAEVILNNILEKAPLLKGENIIYDVRTVDSGDSPGIQLSDLLLGAVMAARRKEATAEAKLKVMASIAKHLDREDLTGDTPPSATKFNIWRFHDPSSGKIRTETTRWTRTP